MSAPTVPIPTRQSAAFNRAVAERLGLDPSVITRDNFRADVEVVSDEELGKVSVSFTAYLPADELLAMFNAAGAA